MNEHIDRLNTALQGRYTIQRELGSGGMATVYLAEDLKHRRQVAIKVLRPELSATLGPERFVREIEIAASLTHPHILTLIDSGEADGLLYYVMPYIEGESLRDRLVREQKLSVSDAVRIMDQVASALSYAHERGVIHRDIKPENILLARDQAIVADFGIARAVEVAGGEKLTGTGIAVGTPAYMSPEQAVGDTNVDARSDVYALGCVVYEMASGRAPFEGQTPQAVLAKHAVNSAPRLRTSDPSIPLFLERAVERALAKQPADRFQTASAFAEALTSEMVVARVGKTRWPRRVAGAVAVVVALVAAAWGLFTFGRGPAYERLAVLPPVNLMDDSEQEHIIQGMLNGLISELGQAGITTIGSVQSMMRYQDTEKTVREIAAELGVDAVIESTVLWVGDSVAVDVRLTDGRTEESLWSQSYDEDARKVLALFRQVTGAVADEIHATLTPHAEAVLASARPVNPLAYEAYLRGQFHLTNLSENDWDQALEYFQRALVLDSTYAPTQAGITSLWVARGLLGIVTPGEAAAHASTAARQALALDSTLAGVQTALALVRTYLEWDWEGGEAGYRKAIEINPNDAGARQHYAWLLAYTERLEEARVQMDRALELDPIRPGIRGFNAVVLSLERRYTEAVEEEEALRRLQPDYTGNLHIIYHLAGNYDKALEMVRMDLPGDQEIAEALDRGYAEGGYRAALRRYGETLAARPEAAEPLSFHIANTYARAGEKERTLEWLERAYRAHHPMLIGASGPEFELVHDDPRYHALRERMGLRER